MSARKQGRAVDIEANIRKYLSERRPTDRYASFDYCFNYFQSHREQGHIAALADGPGLQLSCLHLGFYLASWGMYRGSSALLQRSLKHLVPVVEVLVDSSEGVWTADANDYSDPVCSELLQLAGRLRRSLPEGATDTLVTKILLGVFGCVPAFDQYVIKGSGLRTFNRDSLQRLAQFYEANREIIDCHRIPTLDFDTGEETGRLYTRAKVIDMIFFVEGAG
jgi:hypothetical protein